MPPRKDTLLLLAARQHGVFSHKQALDLGMSDSALRRMTRSGALRRFEGVFQLSAFTADADADASLWAATLRTGGVLSHATAARRLGAHLPAQPIHVMVSYEKHPTSSPSTTTHRSRRLTAAHVWKEPNGLPVTTAPRTFVDLAAPGSGLSDERLIACLDAWVVNQRVSLKWLEWFLDVEAGGIVGRRRALYLVDLVASSQVESVAERECAAVLSRGGIGGFETQYRLQISGRLIARLDFAWPPRRVALEVDGYRYHSGPGAFVADRQRGNEIESAGWRLLRTTPSEIRTDPDRLIRTVRGTLQRAPSPA